MVSCTSVAGTNLPRSASNLHKVLKNIYDAQNKNLSQSWHQVDSQAPAHTHLGNQGLFIHRDYDSILYQIRPSSCISFLSFITPSLPIIILFPLVWQRFLIPPFHRAHLFHHSCPFFLWNPFIRLLDVHIKMVRSYCYPKQVASRIFVYLSLCSKDDGNLEYSDQNHSAI